MDIVINFSPIYNFINLPTDVMLMRVLFLFGWIPIAIVFMWGAKEMWMAYIRGQWGRQQKFILLAIDIPRGNEQSPKAVENIFTYLAGAHGSINLIETYWDGIFQLSFSCEIVCIDGYTQFVIHSPEKFRNLVESAVYSQYPDAEITEIDDYTKGYPTKYPDDEYDIWGSEFILAAPDPLPIKCYDEFMYQYGAPEEQFKDPMAALMDLCSTLGPGEQLWYQVIIIPSPFDLLKEKAEKMTSKILNEKVAVKQNVADKIVDSVLAWISYLSEMVFSIWGDVEEKRAEETDDSLRMMNLKPKEKKQIEAIQAKASKLCFAYKSRMIYLARKEVKNSPKVVNGFVGYMKQFMDIDLNNIKPDTSRTMTSVSYFFREKRLAGRKRRIMNNYMARDDYAGAPEGIMNIEELATIWHFPVESVVKAPMIQKAPGRKGMPPSSLPMSDTRVISDETDSATEIDPIFTETINDLPSPKEQVRKESVETNISVEQEVEDDEIFSNESIDKLREAEEAQTRKIQATKKQDTPIKKGQPPGNLPFV